MAEIEYTGDFVKEETLKPGKTIWEAGVGKADSSWEIDIAQSRFYKVRLYKSNDDQPRIWHFPGKEGIQEELIGSGEYLPVKSISLNYESLNNLTLPITVYNNFSLVSKKSIGTISLTCYDANSDIIENTVHDWINYCFVGTRLRYLSQIYKKFEYTSYNTQGKLNKDSTRSYLVIPTGGVTIGRDYEENGAKLVTFNLAIVGDTVSSATM